MKSNSKHEASSSELRRLLHEGDPLAGEAADAEAARALARVAARLALVASERSRPRPARSLVWSTLGLVTLVAVPWIGARFLQHRPAPIRAGTEPSLREAVVPGATKSIAAASDTHSSAAEPEARQLQFETAGGTRIIWILDPRFEL